MARPRKPVEEKLVPAKTSLPPKMFDRIDRLARATNQPLAWVIKDLLETTLREPKIKI